MASPPRETALQDEVDMATFTQIAEIDDSGSNTFCISLYFDFFGQAEDTFKSMRDALDVQDLGRLSALAHYLKGSSATVGLFKIHDGCERIERYSKRQGDPGRPRHSVQQSAREIGELLSALQGHNQRAEEALRRHFNMGGAA